MVKEHEGDDYFLFCDVCGAEINRADNLDALFMKGKECVENIKIKDFGKVIINKKLCDICKECIKKW